MLYICTRKSKGYGSVAQLNRVLDYGSSGSRFESWRSHEAVISKEMTAIVLYMFRVSQVGGGKPTFREQPVQLAQ